MNDYVKDVLQHQLESLDSQIKWAGEAAMVAKQNLHGRESELTELHRKRKALKEFLGSGTRIDNPFHAANAAEAIRLLNKPTYMDIHDYVYTGDDE